ncbi:unnamed protein product [Lampetra fluviatilis]
MLAPTEISAVNTDGAQTKSEEVALVTRKRETPRDYGRERIAGRGLHGRRRRETGLCWGSPAGGGGGVEAAPDAGHARCGSAREFTREGRDCGTLAARVFFATRVEPSDHAARVTAGQRGRGGGTGVGLKGHQTHERDGLGREGRPGRDGIPPTMDKAEEAALAEQQGGRRRSADVGRGGGGGMTGNDVGCKRVTMTI